MVAESLVHFGIVLALQPATISVQKFDHVVDVLNLRKVDVGAHGRREFRIHLLLLLAANGAVATDSIGTHS
jgi:hypothetical protein